MDCLDEDASMLDGGQKMESETGNRSQRHFPLFVSHHCDTLFEAATTATERVSTSLVYLEIMVSYISTVLSLIVN
jgi:hypothetical protein